MRTKLALAVVLALVLLFLAYFFYLGCEMSEWRTQLIDNERCK